MLKIRRCFCYKLKLNDTSAPKKILPSSKVVKSDTKIIIVQILPKLCSNQRYTTHFPVIFDFRGGRDKGFVTTISKCDIIHWSPFTCFNLATLKEASSADLCFMLICCWMLWRDEKTEDSENPLLSFSSHVSSSNSLLLLFFRFLLLLFVVEVEVVFPLFLLTFCRLFLIERLLLGFGFPPLLLVILVSTSGLGLKALYSSVWRIRINYKLLKIIA